MHLHLLCSFQGCGFYPQIGRVLPRPLPRGEKMAAEQRGKATLLTRKDEKVSPCELRCYMLCMEAAPLCGGSPIALE